MSNRQGFFIFSAQHKNLDAYSNAKANIHCQNQLKDAKIPYKEVLGKYDGFEETSYLVPQKYEYQVIALAKGYGQDSVLYVDQKRNAYFLNLESQGLSKIDGKFQKVNALDALENYTYDLVEQEFYQVV